MLELLAGQAVSERAKALCAELRPSASLRECEKQLQQTADAKPPRARVHRTLLDRLGLADGAQVRVRQGRGEAVVAAVADPSVPPGVVRLGIAGGGGRAGDTNDELVELVLVVHDPGPPQSDPPTPRDIVGRPHPGACPIGLGSAVAGLVLSTLPPA